MTSFLSWGVSGVSWIPIILFTSHSRLQRSQDRNRGGGGGPGPRGPTLERGLPQIQDWGQESTCSRVLLHPGEGFPSESMIGGGLRVRAQSRPLVSDPRWPSGGPGTDGVCPSPDLGLVLRRGTTTFKSFARKNRESSCWGWNGFLDGPSTLHRSVRAPECSWVIVCC